MQNERYSDIAAKNINQQGPSQPNNTLRPQGPNKKTNKNPNQNQQMTSKIFHQKMQKNKNTQKTTGGLVIDENMRNMKDKKTTVPRVEETKQYTNKTKICQTHI